MLVKKCLKCGKEFKIPICRIKTAKFCSRSCTAFSSKNLCNWVKKYKKVLKGENTSQWKGGMPKYICKNCNNIFYSYNPNPLYCSRKCQTIFNGKKIAGKNHPMWKGGKKYTTHYGYVKVYNPEHPSSINNRIWEHRIIAEKYLGRYLTSEERIHHINFIKNDNRAENLYVFSNYLEHNKFHKRPYLLTSNII
jgi:hypothetical protein